MDRERERTASPEGKWLDYRQHFRAFSGKFLGLIQGPPLPVGSLPRAQGPGRGDPGPLWLAGGWEQCRSQGGGSHHCLHTPFPTLRDVATGAGTFLSYQRFWETRRGGRGSAWPHPPPSPSTAPPPGGSVLPTPESQPQRPFRILHSQGRFSSELTSSLRPSLRPQFLPQFLTSFTSSPSPQGLHLTSFLRFSPSPSDSHLLPQTLTSSPRPSPPHLLP